MFKILDSLALLFYCAFIYWLSSQSALPVPNLFKYEDKLHHAGAYFIMAILAWRIFRYFIKPPLLLPIICIGFCSLYGVSDEWHQSLVEGRQSDALDWVADTFGACLAMLFLSRFYPHQRSANNKRAKTIQTS